MASVAGQLLLQSVAERIIALHLVANGQDEVEIVNPWPSSSTRGGVDVTYRFAGRTVKVKVKRSATVDSSVVRLVSISSTASPATLDAVSLTVRRK